MNVYKMVGKDGVAIQNNIRRPRFEQGEMTQQALEDVFHYRGAGFGRP
jgi:hypothetical protein